MLCLSIVCYCLASHTSILSFVHTHTHTQTHTHTHTHAHTPTHTYTPPPTTATTPHLLQDRRLFVECRFKSLFPLLTILLLHVTSEIAGNLIIPSRLREALRSGR